MPWWIVTPLRGLEPQVEGPFRRETDAQLNARLTDDSDGFLVGEPQIVAAGFAEVAAQHVHSD